MLCGSIYMTFWKKQNYRDRKQIMIARDKGGREKRLTNVGHGD